MEKQAQVQEEVQIDNEVAQGEHVYTEEEMATAMATMLRRNDALGRYNRAVTLHNRAVKKKIANRKLNKRQKESRKANRK